MRFFCLRTNLKKKINKNVIFPFYRFCKWLHCKKLCGRYSHPVPFTKIIYNTYEFQMFPKGEKLRKKYFIRQTVRIMHKIRVFSPKIFTSYMCFITWKWFLKMTSCKLTQDAIRLSLLALLPRMNLRAMLIYFFPQALSEWCFLNLFLDVPEEKQPVFQAAGGTFLYILPTE